MFSVLSELHCVKKIQKGLVSRKEAENKTNPDSQRTSFFPVLYLISLVLCAATNNNFCFFVSFLSPSKILEE